MVKKRTTMRSAHAKRHAWARKACSVLTSFVLVASMLPQLAFAQAPQDESGSAAVFGQVDSGAELFVVDEGEWEQTWQDAHTPAALPADATLPTYSGGSGSAADPYQLSSAADLEALRKAVNELGKEASAYFYVLTQDIDLANVEWDSGIGKNSYYPFSGSFDGQGHTIKGLNVKTVADATDATYAGLFGDVITYYSGMGITATVKNLTVEGSVTNVAAASSATREIKKYTGGVIGRASYANVENVVSKVNVTASGYRGMAYAKGSSLSSSSSALTGGIAGQIDGFTSASTTVSFCKNYGTVKSDSFITGGIVGFMYMGNKVADCENHGRVDNYGSFAGGVVGVAGGFQEAVSNCLNDAEVSSSITLSDLNAISTNAPAIPNAIGGVVGYVNGGSFKLSSSVNKGAVTSEAVSVGGVVGCLGSFSWGGSGWTSVVTSGSIVDCYNTGNVSTKASDDTAVAGGVVGVLPTAATGSGSATGCVMARCYNMGNVSAPSLTTGYVGALAGAPYAVSLPQTGSGVVADNVFLQGSAQAAFGSENVGASYNIDGAGAALSADQLKSTSVLGNAYIVDAANTINGGFPYLTWEDENGVFPVSITVTYDSTNNVGDNAPVLTLKKAGEPTQSFDFTLGEAAEDGSRMFTGNLPNGSYTYTVSQKGYGATSDSAQDDPVSGTFTVQRNACDVSVSLLAKRYQYTLDYEPADAYVSSAIRMSAASAALDDASALDAAEEGAEEEAADGNAADASAADVAEQASATKTFTNLTNGSYVIRLHRFGYASLEHTTAISYGNASGAVSLAKNPDHALNIAFSLPEGDAFTSDNLPQIVLSAKDASGSTYEETFTATVDANDGSKASISANLPEFAAPEGAEDSAYTYFMTAAGYNSKRGTFSLAADCAYTFNLEPKSMWDGTIDTSWYDPENPQTEYVITTPEQLAGVSDLVHQWGSEYNTAKYQTTSFEGVTLKLAADIDLGGSNGYNWMPIGYYSSACSFRGTFDGQGHTIKGLSHASTKNMTGLFGGVVDGTIKNLTVEGTVDAYMDAGGIAGSIASSTISNCVSNVDIRSTSISGHVGGIVGSATWNFNDRTKMSVVENCVSNGSVITTGASTTAGGIVGNANQVEVVACINNGAVAATGAVNNGSLFDYYATGGIIGSGGRDALVNLCINNGDVSGVNAGGIAGDIEGTTVTNSYNTATVAGVNANGNASALVCVGGVVGMLSQSASSSYDPPAAVVKNCYSRGQVVAPSAGRVCIGSVLGASANTSAWPIANSSKIVNNYGLADAGATGAFGGWACTSRQSFDAFDLAGVGETISADALKGLASALGVEYLADTDGTYNEGFPYLLWQNPNAQYNIALSVTYDSNANAAGTMPTVKLFNKATGAEIASSGQSGYTWNYTVDAGEYYYTVEQAGYQSVGPVDFTISSHSAELSAQLKIVRAALSLTVDPADATLIVSDAAGNQLTPESTDDQAGSYVFRVSKGSYSYAASKFGYELAQGTIDVGFEDVASTVMLQKSDEGNVAFEISPAEGLFKSQGATVVLMRDGVEVYRFTQAPDADGFVRLNSTVSVGTYSYTVVASGYARSSGEFTVGKDAPASVSVTLAQKGAWDGTADYSWGLGTNYTRNDTFTITSEEELAGLAYLVNSRGVDFSGKTINLVCDLDLGNRSWSPIGRMGRVFAGTFNGGGFSIDGLSISMMGTYSSSADFGLFGYTQAAQINDVVVRGNLRLTLSVTPTTACALGGIVAHAVSTSFTRCGSEVNIMVGNTADSVALNVGGIVGWGVSSTFESCYNTGTIDISSRSVSQNGQASVGGLVGFENVGNAGFMSNSYNLGAVMVDVDRFARAGGLAGMWGGSSSTIPTISIANSFNAGFVTASVNTHVEGAELYAGAVIGSVSTSNDASSVLNTYYVQGTSSAAFGTDAASIKGKLEATEISLADAIDPSFVDTLNAGGAAFRATAEPYYPMLSWQKDVVSVELVKMPDKLSYVDGDNFDGAGAQMKVQFASGDVIVVESGWVAVNGQNLRPDTTEVVLSYQGHTVLCPVEVSWHDQALPSKFALSVASPAPNAAPQTTLDAQGNDMIDALPHFDQSVTWYHAGSVMQDTLFAPNAYYRAKVKLVAQYDDEGHYVFPDDIKVSVEGSYAVGDVSVSESGRVLCFTMTFAPTSTASPDLEPAASHLYYEGDAQNPLASALLPGENALTLIGSDGTELSLSLQEIEELVLREPVGRKTVFSEFDGAEISQHSYTGIGLYKLLQLYGVLYTGMADETAVTLVDGAGNNYALTMGDIRNARSVYDSSQNLVGKASAQVSFAKDDAVFLEGNSLLAATGPLVVNLGMESAKSDSQTVYENIVRVEIGEPVTANQSKLSFTVSDDLGASITNFDATVTDQSGNEVARNGEDGTFSLNDAEEYAYKVSKAGYTVASGSVCIEQDTTIEASIVPCWDGETLTEPQKDDEGYYIIGTGAELAWWNRNGAADSNVRLTRDIGIGDAYTYEPLETDGLDKGNWTPQGTAREESAYSGTFDGQGHTIYGLYINRENTIDLWVGVTGEVCMISDRRSVIGMFGYTSGATIKDLGVVGKIDVLDRPDSMYADWLQVGGIVGMAQAGTVISGCYANVGISIVQSTGSGYITGDDGTRVSYDGFAEACDQYLGGIAGSISSRCEIDDCYSTGAYVGGGTRSVSAGGIVGGMRGVGTSVNMVSSCYSDAILAGTPLDTVADTSIQSCFGGVAGKPLAASGVGMVPDGMGTTATSEACALARSADVNECYSLAELAAVANEAESGADKDALATGAVSYVQHCFAFNSIINGKLDETSNSKRSIAGRVYGNANAQGTDNYALQSIQIINATQIDDESANGKDITSVDARFASTYANAQWNSEVWNLQDESWPVLAWQRASGFLPPITDSYQAAPHKDSQGFDFTVSVRVAGHDPVELKSYTLADMERFALQDSADGTKLYSSYSYGGPAGRVVTKYVYPETILNDLGISFASGDVWRMGMDYDYDTYFGAKRYYFPQWDRGVADGAQEIRPVIAMKSYGGSSGMSEALLKIYASSADMLWTYVLNFGQTDVFDYTYSRFIYQQSGATIVYGATDDANETVCGLLEGLLERAQASLGATSQGTDASQVSFGVTFVSPELYKELQDACLAAQGELDSSIATNDSVMSAYENLESALARFDAGKQTGAYQEGLNDLQAAVDVTLADARDTIIDVDAENVSSAAVWVTSDAQAKLLDTLRDAQEVLAANGLVPDAVLSDVCKALLAVTDGFDASKRFGSASDMNHIIRRAGDTRYTTAVAVSQSAYPLGADTVVIATGENFPDALSGAAFAGTLNAPLLLASTGGLVPEALNEIARLGAHKAVLLGGSAALPDSIVGQLASVGIDSSAVTRIAGDTRFDTSIAIYDRARSSWGRTAIVASGMNYPDALSIAGYSYASAAPVFLADAEGNLSASARGRIALGSFDRVLLIGGESVVAQDVPLSLRNAGFNGEIVRLSGDDRYATNSEVNKWLLSEESGSGFTLEHAGFATGKNFADALTGSVLVGLNKTVLVLGSFEPGDKYAAYIDSRAAQIGTAYIFGGTASVSADFARHLNAAIDYALQN